MSFAKFLLGLSLASAAASASAVVTYTATSGLHSQESVTDTITFDDASVLPAGYATYDDIRALIASPGNPGYAAQPPGDNTSFFSVGITNQPSSSSVSFSGLGASYFGFYMGSPDSYNIVELYSGNTLLLSLDGTQMATAALQAGDGNQGVGFYMNFFAGNSAPITKVTFSSSNRDAFESDNHSYIAAVPEPETYAMLLAGLGLVGAMARRRKQAA